MVKKFSFTIGKKVAAMYSIQGFKFIETRDVYSIT